MRRTTLSILSRLSASITTATLLTVLLPGAIARGDDDSGVVRLAVVNAPQQSGLLSFLLPGFEKMSGYEVRVYSGSDVYQHAEHGEADIIISHFGKAGVEPFVTRGMGMWPRPVFSNQSVLIGPKSDPARIRGMTDPFAAMKKIAESGSPFVSAADPGTRYLSELLIAGAGNPDRGTWYIETRQMKGRAMQFAEEKEGYTVWGSFPFERFRRNHGTGLEVMVWNTPVFHRVMATIVVNPESFPGANVEGARALEAYLLSPAVQGAVAAFREQGPDRQTWWPAARHNNPAQLLGVSESDDAEE